MHRYASRIRTASIASLLTAAFLWIAACFPSLDGLVGGSNDASVTEGAAKDAFVKQDGGPPFQGAVSCGTQSYCRASAPSGWDGPGIVREDTPSVAPCGAPPFVIPSAKETRSGLAAEPTSCPCTCGPPSTECSYSVSVYGAAGCSGSVKRTLTLNTNGCDVNTGFSESLTLSGTQTKAGSCVPDGGSVKPAATWNFRGHFCSGSFYAGSCSGGNVCVEGNAKVCIARSGDVPCPGAPYTERQVMYANVEDTRGCSACTCGAPIGACTLPTLQNHANLANNACINPGGLLKANDAGCYDGIQWYKPGPAGACPPIPGTPTGALTATEPTTICCEAID